MSSEQSALNSQQLARTCWAVLFGILAVSACILYLAIHFFLLRYEPRQEPLLSTPAAFTLLAIVVALSAYLRSVAGAADDKRHKIRANQEPLYPMTTPSTPHTICKLSALDKSYERLQIGARFLIWLTIIVGLRLVLESIARFGFYLDPHASYFRVIDMWVFEWLALAIMVLAVMHYKGHRRDEAIRDSMLKWLESRDTHFASPDVSIKPFR